MWPPQMPDGKILRRTKAMGSMEWGVSQNKIDEWVNYVGLLDSHQVSFPPTFVFIVLGYLAHDCVNWEHR
jgi:hypothetical protein